MRWRLGFGLELGRTAVLLQLVTQARAATGPSYSPLAHPNDSNSTAVLYSRQDGGGYGPAFGSCGTGETCAEACGEGFETCGGDTGAVLFCYDPGAGQSCCPDGQGRACDAGFYCVKDPTGGTTYCCDDQLNLSDHKFDDSQIKLQQPANFNTNCN
ncbi:hypothetical protein B0T22DRAFT_478389 [Podospora appendiculata]|uniref:Uncharacterized protein n=1 Tax=Podospora appendiculata TaxID=314037 RepID=A0AAE0XM19_9PEZI|nr:hypothetical protein B0T22DRAFT_478389 [Podospora appendiculata]